MAGEHGAHGVAESNPPPGTGVYHATKGHSKAAPDRPAEDVDTAARAGAAPPTAQPSRPVEV